MGSASLCDISVWIDSVDSTPQDVTTAPLLCFLSYNDKENPRPPKKSKRRLMDDSGDLEDTPRPNKRQRDADDAPHVLLSGPHFFPSPSPTKSNTTPSEASTDSHHSGRLSPSKQLQTLEDIDRPVFFRNFGDVEEHEEREDVGTMRDAIQRLADGVGILGYEAGDLQTATVSLSSPLDRRRFAYPWANDCTTRLTYGTMPSIASLERIVGAGWENDRGTGTSEDDWNTDVQHPLIKLALETSAHKDALSLHGVKTVTIEPGSLARTREGLPRRIVDYVVALKPDDATRAAWPTLAPAATGAIKSYNHITRNNLRTCPIAINIGTKGPHKSWTDGKPQLAIWTDAWLNRLAMLPRATDVWPAIPLLIAQGHDWHVLVICRERGKTVIRGQIAVGSSRSCFDAMKVVAVLHWCMGWAERVWRPWFLSLL